LVRQVFRGKAQFAAAVLLAALAGCRPTPGAVSGEAATAEVGYVAPPAITAAAPGEGHVTLSGEASAGAQIRLATPGGQALATQADGEGRWRLRAPTDGQAKIFGLSAVNAGRRVQAQGYVLVGPRGQTALLRAGAAALRLDRPSGSRISVVDFDSEGGVLLSGWAAAGTDVAIRLDGHLAGDARTDDDGRFVYAWPRLSRGSHRVEATGVAFTDAIAFDISPPTPLVDGPLHSQLTPQGFRADWLTPGGGVQSTILAG
jgi:hypothetical protein